MTRVLLALLIIAVPFAHAADREIFPSDYKAHPCTPKKMCASFDRSELAQSGARMQGYTAIKQTWLTAHWDEMVASFGPYCAKLGSCYATPGNTYLFCDDLVIRTAVAICDQYPPRSDDHEQCILFVRTYGTGITFNSFKPWQEAQACMKALPPPPNARQLDVWTVPARLPVDFKGKLFVYAVDRDTHVPVQANITIGSEELYADTPGGRPMTGYAVKWNAKLVRVPNGSGHSDVVPPQVSVQQEGYETVTFAMPVDVPKMIVEMTPSPDKLKRGKNSVTVHTRDAATGKTIEARVMIGDRVLGDTNKPLELEIQRGRKRAAIWVTSMYDRYSDVVVVPAER